MFGAQLLPYRGTAPMMQKAGTSRVFFNPTVVNK